MGIESEIHVRESDGAPDELYGAEREHHGERDLSAHEREPRPGTLGTAAL